MNETRTVDIETLIPYWRNPRDNRHAIEKVKESIREYGYQTPILVDKELTIIAGHTRYRALKELGYTRIAVVVSDIDPKKAKEFRIIDNKTSEYATWTDDLAIELREFTNPVFRDFYFPDFKLNLDFSDKTEAVTPENTEKTEEKLLNQFQNDSVSRENELKMTIFCPNCSNEITLKKADMEKERNWE
jgi:DNA-directed RNA polymerase subunit F